MCQTLHQDQPLPGEWSGHLLPQGQRGHPLPRETRVGSHRYLKNPLDLIIKTVPECDTDGNLPVAYLF